MSEDLQATLDEMVEQDLIATAYNPAKGEPEYRTTMKGCAVMGLAPTPTTPGPWPTLPGHE